MKLKLTATALITLLVCGLGLASLAPTAAVAGDETSTDSGATDGSGTGGGSGQTSGDDGTGGGSGQQ